VITTEGTEKRGGCRKVVPDVFLFSSVVRCVLCGEEVSELQRAMATEIVIRAMPERAALPQWR
jgi:hypothetical protein